jgi:ribonuclease D
MNYAATTSNLPVLRRGDLSPEDVESLETSRFTAWDIETSGLDYRSEHIGTVQVADSTGRTWIVKVNPGTRPDILCAILSDASKRKVFHYAPFDLGFLRYHWSARARNVACTKVLDRLVEPEATSHSLKDVLWRELNVSLPKEESIRRSDWDALELSPDQLNYAAGDVAHLLPLYEHLMDRAVRQGVSRLAEESFEYLPVRVETELMGLADLFAY